MNSDIVIRVIDWFVSICETQLGKRPWLMEKEGGKKKPKTTIFVRSPETVDMDTDLRRQKVFGTH